MRYKTVLFAFISILSAAILINNGVTAYADATDADVKQAALNAAQISFNGKEPVTIQCYNIDGFNYFRIKDIAMNLNMTADPNYNAKSGIIIRENKPYSDTNTLPELTVDDATVYIRSVPMFYAGAPMNVQSFVLDNESYFKLADIQTLSDTVKAAFDSTKKESFTGISIVWDANASVIDITMTHTDYE